MKPPTKVYAMYDGDELVAVGTASQLAKMFGCSKQRIYWLASAQARRKHAVAVDQPTAMAMFSANHTEAMNEICSRIVRHTRGLCRVSEIGCDWLGWCEPCYRGACQLVVNRRKEKQ